MNKLFYLAVLIYALPLFAAPLHWEDCFHAALKRSESLKDQDELIYQSNEKHRQALGAMLPQLSLGGTHENLSTPSALESHSQDSVQLTLNQPLFKGFRDFSSLRQMQDLNKSAKQTKARSLVQLYQQVATAFFQVVAAEQDIQNVDSEEKLYRKQIRQLEAWMKIGRSRRADVTATKSQSAQLLATLEASREQLSTAREALAYLTGLDRNVAVEDSFPKHFSAPLDPLGEYLSAIDHRPEVMADFWNQEAAREGIDIARSYHWPTLDLEANLYGLRNGQNRENNGTGEWDVLLNLNFPIFSGGVTQSQVRVAHSQFRESGLFLSQDKRLAEREIRTYYNRVMDDEKQVKALVIAKKLAWQSYQEELKNYARSMTTNIDVLQSLTAFTTTERTLDQVRFQKRIDYLYLQAAAGKVKELAAD